LAEGALGGGAAGDHVWVAEPPDAAGVGLPRVREREVRVLEVQRGRVVRVVPDEAEVVFGAGAVEVEDGGLLDVAAELELGDGLEARRRAWVADDEDELALFRAVFAPREEVVRGVERPPVLAVGAQEREVERV